MKKNKVRSILILSLVCAMFAFVLPTQVAAKDTRATGILLVTGDHGFMANANIKDSFDIFAKDKNAAILYVSGHRSENILGNRIAELQENGAKSIIVLPLFISKVDSKWQSAVKWIKQQKNKGTQFAIAKPYGSSYLAVEDLSSLLRKNHANGKKLLLLGSGASTSAAVDTLTKQLKRLGAFASTLDSDDILAAVRPGWRAKDKNLKQEYDNTLKKARGAVAVEFSLSTMGTSMGTSWTINALRKALGKDSQIIYEPITTKKKLAKWMQYATTKASLQLAPLDPSEVGIVALSHGAGWFWNQAIKESLKPVSKDYNVVFTYSMASQPTIEYAVDKLTQKGVKAIVIVRIFSMKTSFRSAIERMFGWKIETGQNPVSQSAGGHGHSMMMHMGGQHGHGTSIAASPRIYSALPMVTLGGVEDSPYLAKSLLENARRVSIAPERETVIVTAHGLGNEKDNAHWISQLHDAINQIKDDGGDNFKAFEIVTWQEDWPKYRQNQIEKARKLVKEANKGDGRAIVVPARINGRGGADRYLKGLNFGWGQGFAQTPYFAQWFEQEVKKGIAKLNDGNVAVATSDTKQMSDVSTGHHH